MSIRPCKDGKHNFNIYDLDHDKYPCQNDGCPIAMERIDINRAQELGGDRGRRLLGEIIANKDRDWWVEWEIQE